MVECKKMKELIDNVLIDDEFYFENKLMFNNGRIYVIEDIKFYILYVYI